MKNAREWLVSRLVSWFRKNGREFEWRKSFPSPDPYEILVAELMLQRTKAKQVERIYREFIEKFPSLSSVTNASDQEIIGVFEKLGLRSRAKRIPGIIRELNEKFGGEIPRTYEELSSLHGVGSYVANAVRCYAYGVAVVPVDTNVVRIVSRFFGLQYNDSTRRSKEFQEFVNELLPEDNPRNFNLALLDLGAMICKARTPLHQICPLCELCKYSTKYQKSGVVGLS